MWFKNLSLLKIAKEFTTTPEALEVSMQNHVLKPCSAFEKKSFGWVPPVKGGEQLVHTTDGFMLFTMATEERVLPASVVKEEVDEAIEGIQSRENRRVGAKEKKELREKIEEEMLPMAFIRTRKVNAYIDPVAGWLLVDTPSAAVIEKVASILRMGLGSFPVTPPNATGLPREVLTSWVRNGNLPEALERGDRCEIHGIGDDKSVASYKNHELSAEAVTANIDAGGMVASLGLVWDGKISLVFSENMTIKSIKFLDAMAEKLDEQDTDGAAEQLDVEFMLMAGEFRQMLGDLMPNFCKVESALFAGDSQEGESKEVLRYKRAMRALEAGEDVNK